MFYLVDLTRQVDVEPKMFGPRLEDSIKHKVATEVSLIFHPPINAAK